MIQQTGQPNSPFLVLGTFTNFSGLGSGKSYSRTEAVTLPVHISGLYNVEVITNFDGELFENGATANNTGIALQPMTVTVMPRPDLQVAADRDARDGQRGRIVLGHLHRDQPGDRTHDRQLGRQDLPVADAVRRRRLDPDRGPSQPGGARHRAMSTRRRRSRSSCRSGIAARCT